MIRIAPIASRPGPVRIADFVWAGAEPDAAVHMLTGGDRRLFRSSVTHVEGASSTRRLCSWGLTPSGPVALDVTVFSWDDERFAETEQYRASGGPNLHQRPIVLPALLHGDPVFPFGDVDVTVRLGFSGVIDLEGHRLDAIRLDVEERGERRLQWLAAGIGEIALGTSEGLERWMIGWRGGRDDLLAGVADDLLRDLPPLPERSADRPRRTLR